MAFEVELHNNNLEESQHSFSSYTNTLSHKNSLPGLGIQPVISKSSSGNDLGSNQLQKIDEFLTPDKCMRVDELPSFAEQSVNTF